MKKYLLLFILLFGMCKDNSVRVSDDTFVHNGKVYKIVDNQILFLGNLNDSVKKFSAAKFDYMRKLENQIVVISDRNSHREDTSMMNIIYRGSTMYYHFILSDYTKGFSYNYSGTFDIKFEDKNGFILLKDQILFNQLEANLNGNGEIDAIYDYQGKIEISSDIYQAISKFEIGSKIHNTSIY